MTEQLDYRGLIKNMVTAFVAQGSAVLMSIVTTLLLPKVLGVSEYGYWQLFIFYTGYAGIFHFGISEGVYLVNGGKHREELNQNSLNSQFRLSLIYQSLILIVLGAISVSVAANGERCFVLLATCIFVILNNATYFLGYIFQAINDTKRFSYSVMIDRLVFLIPLVLMLVLRVKSFEPYVCFYAVSKIIALVYCCWQARDILSSPLISPKEAIVESISSIKIGIKLMLANLTSMLIIGIARFTVDAIWGVEEFGTMALALSMVNFFLQFASQVGMVLFPALKRIEPERVNAIYTNFDYVLSAILPIIYLLYYPICIFVSHWLPEYETSLIYLALLLPMCVYDGKMNIIYSTYFKALRQEKLLLKVNAIALAESLMIAIIGGYILHSEIVIVAGASVAVITRSILSEKLLTGKAKVRQSPIATFNFFFTAAFIVVAGYFAPVYSFFVSLVLYIVLLVLFRNKLSYLLIVFKKSKLRRRDTK